jgi:protein-L-isoaspartate(D-aspartate) O-methyltransferase
MTPTEGASREEASWQAQREEMVRTQIVRRGISHPLVLEAMRAVPRHLLLPDRLRSQAYSDQALPIGEGQTISQPYIVACMLAALEPTGAGRALDVGVGSGYQTALLSRLYDDVVGVERVVTLAERARRQLEALGCANVRVVVADGTLGYPDAAPYDAIVVGAGAPEVPQPLVEQLSPEGRLVIPVGDRHLQRITTVTKAAHGSTTEEGLGCVFVPLLGEHGW